nr:hypothetical protein [Tanacetum cinerariifolium]
MKNSFLTQRDGSRICSNNDVAKLPLLKQDNGNSFKPVPRITSNADGTSTSTIYGPVTTEEKAQKKNDVKARSMLLIALLNEHLLTFSQYKDAKTLFEAIQARFSGNDATKKTQRTLLKQMYKNFNAPITESINSIFNRLHKIVSQLAILGENISQEDLNMKFLRSLPSEWNTHVVVWRNKVDLDIMSIDDLYNNFKIVEQEVKRIVVSISSSGSPNMAFLSSLGSTNKVDTASIKVSVVSTPVSIVSSHDNTTNLSDVTVYAFLANQSNGSQLLHEDLEQIHEDDMKEIDLKWQLAFLSMRARRYFQRTGKKITINGSNTAGYDKTKVECFNCHKMEYFARECRSLRNQESKPKNQDSSRKTMIMEDTSSKAMTQRIEFNKYEFDLATYKRGLAFVEEQLVFYQKNEVVFCDQIVVLKRDALFGDSEITALNLQIEKLKKEKESNRIKIDNFKNASKSLDKLIGSQITDNSKIRLGFTSYNVVAPLLTGLFAPPSIDLSNSGLEEFQHLKFKGYGPKDNKSGAPHDALKDQGYFDSGCFRHMTGNISYLTDFKEHDGGYVTIGGGAKGGKITSKGIIRTGKQNGVAERRNRTVIEAARTKLADSKLPTTFCAEAVSTACYVQNRVLVVKPHFKTPYELFKGRLPALSFMRPFGCHVLILNILDRLGKFDGKSDEGIFVGYSTTSKAFRVYNIRTRKVEENLHINFLENKPLIAGGGLEWLFDIDALSKSINYASVYAGTNSNDFADNSLFDSSSQALYSHNKDKHGPSQASKSDNHERSNAESSTKTVNTATPTYVDYPNDPLMPDLEDARIFDDAYDDRDEGAEADYNNLETLISVSPIPSTRIHKDHPKEHIIGEVNSAVQTKKMAKQNEAGLIFFINKQRRTNHKDFQNCLFACFLSQMEPKKVTQALDDESWVEAIQEELLQFKLLNVWTLVDLPPGKRAIETKWVYSNKRDQRGIVIRNKARQVAQGHRQEEGIDYDEVFAPVARIKAFRLFIAYASFMDFTVYQMDVKSAFLYGTIEEEVYVSQPPGFVDPEFPDRLYKVEKALYGLHQAPRAWYETSSTYLLDNRFRRATIDKTLFIKKIKDDILLVQVYVYDIIFGSTKRSLSIEFKQLMHKRFQISSTGELTFFLGLQSASTPMETHKPLSKDAAGIGVDVHLYSLDRKSTTGGFQFLGSRIISLQCKKQTIMTNSITKTKIYVDNESAICVVKNLVYHSKTKHIKIRHHFIRDSNETRLIEMVKIHTDYNVLDLLTKAFDVTRFQFLIASIGLELKGYLINDGYADLVQHAGDYFNNTSARVKKVNDEVRIQALVDGKKVNIKESSITRILRLDDTEGTSCLTNTKIFKGLARMGAKTTSWNEFSSTMASAIICLATNQKFNFSREVTSLFDNKLVQAPEEVGILQADAQPIPIPTETLTSKPQKKYKPKRKHTKEPEVPPTESQAEHNVPLASLSHDPLPSGEDSLKLKELMDLYTNLSNKVLDLKSEVIDIKSTYKAKIEELESRVERLEEENMVLKELKGVHSTVDSDEPVIEKKESSKQGRKIAVIDADVEINLEKV